MSDKDNAPDTTASALGPFTQMAAAIDAAEHAHFMRRLSSGKIEGWGTVTYGRSTPFAFPDNVTPVAAIVKPPRPFRLYGAGSIEATAASASGDVERRYCYTCDMDVSKACGDKECGVEVRAAQPVQAGEAVDEHEQAIDLMRKLERDGLEFVCMDGSANVVGIIKAAWKYRASLAPVAAPELAVLTNERIAEIYRTSFEGMPGAARNAPKAPPLVIEFGKAIEREVRAAQKAATSTMEAPIFWYRPIGNDGLYEGPVHNNSVGGKRLRDEKPGEWVPLYRAVAPVSAQQGAAVASSLDDLMTYSSLHGTLVRLADAKCRLAETERNLEGALRALGAENGPTFMGEPTLPARSIPNVDTMVNRFLGWSLPKDFSPDCGISFDGRKDDEWNKNKSWPTGTNLFAATQAKAMFEYCLASPASTPEAAPEQQLANDWEEDFKHENGQYEGRCSNCGCRFIGHKRRCVCKACYDRAAPTAGAATISEDAQMQAERDVLAERRRQVEQEGWKPEHDDKYQKQELRWAAFCYMRADDITKPGITPGSWPWPEKWWKPTTDRRNLVKACALVLAEIERIDRAGMRATQQEGGNA